VPFDAPLAEQHAFIQRQVLLLVVYVLVIYSVATRAEGATAVIVVATRVLAAVAGPSPA
jgi:hypothetical protein